MDVDVDVDVDMEIVEVPIDPEQKSSGSDTRTDTGSQLGSLSVSDPGSSEGRSVVTTVSIQCDKAKSDESDVSSPPLPSFSGDEESDDEWRPPVVRHAQTYRVAMSGLAYFNAKNKGAEYEYVSPVMCVPVFLGDYFAYHANFFARNKADNTSDPKLFFVEEAFSPPDINWCEILEPQPFALGETAPEAAYGGGIFHPKGLMCVCGVNPRFKEGKAYSTSLIFHNYRKTLEAAAAANAS